MLPRKLLIVLLSIVLVSAAAYAAVAPVNPDEPITMTKGMYADLLCIAASDFKPNTGGIQFAYESGNDTIRATYLPARVIASEGKYAAQNAERRKATAKEQFDYKLKLLLPKFQRYVSPSTTTTSTGF